MATLADAPNAGSPDRVARLAGTRRLLLRRTGFHVYYTVDSEAVVVRALWHAVRGRGPKL